ncbi:MAG: sensor histidine kinase [Victivallales bacterium]|nr:sensor histidine kinase [Victivallales bacterium]
MSAIDDNADICECEIITREGSAVNLRVWSFPFHRGDHDFVLCVLRDIADEKYRHFLEHIFFHDLTNIGAGIYNLLSLIGNTPHKYIEYSDMLVCLAREILNEIEAQRDLLDAESGTIAINIDTISPNQLLHCVKTLFRGNPAAEGREIVLPEHPEKSIFHSDPRLLTRVIGNMVKNALEASCPGEKVLLSCHRKPHHMVFSVHNRKYIDEDIQLQLFKRAFSSKGRGRGLGTYSMRLLGEHYLKGRVSFSSTPEEGTTFYIELPLDPETP